MSSREQLSLNIKLNINGTSKILVINNLSNIESTIDHFLRQNKLGSKYKEQILTNIRNELYKQEQQGKKQVIKKPQERAAKVIKEQKISVVNSKVTYSNQVVEHEEKGSIIDEMQKESNGSCEGSRLIYQKWKAIEKKKNQRQPMNTVAKSEMIKRETNHYPPDYMYMKGQLNKKIKEDNCEQIFKELYPFRTKQAARSLSKDHQHKLYNKLHNSKHYQSYDQKNDRKTSLSPQKMDKIKSKMKTEDSLIDYELYKILKHYKIQSKAKRR